MPKIEYDESLILEIAARFDLREPNRLALAAVVKAIVAADMKFIEMVADLATGVGKTFLMSSLVDYLATQGVRHVLVVTPNSTIQTKTLSNFDEASTKYVAGAEIVPFVITPENFQRSEVGTVLRDTERLKVFVFNVQQLIRPSDKVSRRVRENDEILGDALYSYLGNTEDLFVIADEHHIYHERAKAFSMAVRDLQPMALVGLTATPDAADIPKIVFQYTLGEAIADGHVKVPVIVYRKDGTKDERTQLTDACQLLRAKETAYTQYSTIAESAPPVRPVLFVVCQSIDHAGQVGQMLAGAEFIGDPSAVLEITSQSSDEALQALADVERLDSPIRAIVSVNMLREGWDVKNIAVIVALRKLASQTLTEQILGRGLRLPFGRRTGVPMVDQVDLVAHDSYQALLAQKDVLRRRLQIPAAQTEVDAQGAATPTDPAETPFSDSRPEADSTDVVNAVANDPNQGDLFTMVTEPEEDTAEATPVLLLQEAEERKTVPGPEPRTRVEGAPSIVFPRQEARLITAQFSLSDVHDGDAEAAGARFIREVPTFIFRDALDARRRNGEIAIVVDPQKSEEARQEVASLDTVREELTQAIMRQPEVAAERREKTAARRLVSAFLRGAGVTSTERAAAEWGQHRRQQAVEGIRQLIRTAIGSRKQERTYVLTPVSLPLEPVLVDPNAPQAYEDAYRKNVHFQGWKKNIMPTASFDAKSTEWALAQLLDRDEGIKWWLRIYTNGQAFIHTDTGRYFPDFIAIDEDGDYWIIEGKSDADASDAAVLAKKAAANRWARFIRDGEEFGVWRYIFATESHIKHAAGSWNGLLTATNPE